MKCKYQYFPQTLVPATLVKMGGPAYQEEGETSIVNAQRDSQDVDADSRNEVTQDNYRLHCITTCPFRERRKVLQTFKEKKNWHGTFEKNEKLPKKTFT